MSTFIWQDHYQIGNEKIDTQHQDLFDLANQIIDATGADEITHLLMLFYQHVREHFQSEENLMKQYNYPGHPVHAEAHNLLLDKLIDISKTIQNKQWDQADIRTFVNDWVLKHILEVDMLLGEFIAKRSEVMTP